MMMSFEKDKLVKLLMLTTSSFDGEALSAIRKANEYIKKYKMCWEEVFTSKKEVEVQEEDIDRYDSKQQNISQTRDILNSLDISFEEKNNGYHFIIKHNGHRIEYYPTSGTVMWNGKRSNWNLNTLVMKLRNMS